MIVDVKNGGEKDEKVGKIKDPMKRSSTGASGVKVAGSKETKTDKEKLKNTMSASKKVRQIS